MAFKSTYNTSVTNEMRESLLDIIRDVSPNEDNYFMSNLAKGPNATQTLHQWNIYHEGRATAVAVSVQGADTTYPEPQIEVRSTNYTAIVESPVAISRTKASIAMVTGEDAYGKDKERALRRLKSKMEYAIINGAAAVGSSATAAQLCGILGSVTTNVSNYPSGLQSFTETLLNDMVQRSWNSVGASYVGNILAVPVVLKRRVAAFGTNLTRTIPASEKRLTNEVRVYDSDVGPTVMIIAHKDIPTTAAAGADTPGNTALLINDSLLELAFLVKSGEPHWEDRAKTGDRENGTYITEFTLVNFDEQAAVKSGGFLTTL
jgi:hypothetical protein